MTIRFLNSTILFIWIVGALYFGSGGVTSLELTEERNRIDALEADNKDTVGVFYDGMKMKNKSLAEIRRQEKEFEAVESLAYKVFPWLNLPYRFLGLLITSIAFGILGASIALLRDITKELPTIENAKIFSKPFLGGGCGIIILSIAYVLPEILVSGETQIKSTTIVLISLFGGLFTEKFFDWFSSAFNRIFKPTN
ncbi:MAG: hypothetical protein ACKO96_43115 [Flammeovirgaceae bacterium]